MSAGDIDLGWETIKSLVGKFIQAGLGFAGIVIFARILGKSGFGGFYLLLSIVMLADRPIRGFGAAVRKRWSEVGAERSEILGITLIVNGSMCLVAALVVWVFRDSLVSYTGLAGAPELFIVLFASFAFFVPVQRMLEGEGLPSKQTWNDTLRSILTLPLQIGFVLIGFGAVGMGYGLAVATIACIPTAYYFTRVIPSVPSVETIWSLTEYAKYSIPGTIVGKAYDRIDVLLLGFLAGTASVANYEVALKLTVPATFLGGVIGSALIPKISNLHSQGSDFSQDVTNSLGYVSTLSIPLFFGTIAISHQIVVTAFGGKYSNAAPFLIGLALYQVINSQKGIYTQTLSGMNLPDVNLKISSFTLVVNVLLGVGLLFTIGPIGIVIATVISEGMMLVIMSVIVTRKTEINPFPRSLLMQIIAGFAMYLVVEYTHEQVPIQSWVHLGIVVGIGACAYGIVLFSISPGIRFTARSIYHDALKKGTSK